MKSPNGKALSDVVTLYRGTTYKSNLLDKAGPVLLGLASIAPNGGFRRGSLRTYGGESDDRILLSPGDLYVALKDVTQSGDLLGAVARVPTDVALGRLTQDTVKLQIIDGEVDARFLYWVLRTPQYRAYCRSHAIGTTNLSLARNDFLAFTLPPLTAERRELTRALGALDDKIELNRRIAATCHELAHAIFRSRYRSDDPNLPHAALGEHLEVARGLSYTGAGLADDGMPLHNLDSVVGGGGYNRTGIKYYVGPYKDRHLVRPGDVVMANTDLTWNYRVIASPAMVPSRFGNLGLFSHHLYRVRPTHSSPLSSRLIYLMLLPGMLRREIAGYANGTTVNMLPIDALNKPCVAVPSPEVVEEIDALVTPLFDRAEAAEDESETLARLRDTLLPKLISGEMRLKEVERVL